MDKEALHAAIVDLAVDEFRKAVEAKTIKVNAYLALGEVCYTLKGLDKLTAKLLAAV